MPKTSSVTKASVVLEPSKNVTKPFSSITSHTIPTNMIINSVLPATVEQVPSASSLVRVSNSDSVEASMTNDNAALSENNFTKETRKKNKENREKIISDDNNGSMESCFRVWTLPWQKLVKPDVHVLTAVENSLKNSSMIDHTIQFFMNVMLYDYPPEVFLQRRPIIKVMYD